jgi:hypothetical protein
MTSYNNCTEAVLAFSQLLEQRGLHLSRKEKVKAYAGDGRYVNEDRIFTTTNEVYHIKCRPRGRWIPKDSTSVSPLGKELDLRYKFLIGIFGAGDPSLSGLNEDTMIDLLLLEEGGHTPYLVTIFPQTAEFLWCHAFEAYNLIMRYGTLPQMSFQGMHGMTLCSIPTGWMKKWARPLVGYPTISK